MSWRWCPPDRSAAGPWDWCSGRSTLGQPGDVAGQMAVLRGTLAALAAIQAPGGIVHLPFEWPENPKQVHNHPPEPPPIARYLARNPWFLPRLLSRNVPE